MVADTSWELCRPPIGFLVRSSWSSKGEPRVGCWPRWMAWSREVKRSKPRPYNEDTRNRSKHLWQPEPCLSRQTRLSRPRRFECQDDCAPNGRSYITYIPNPKRLFRVYRSILQPFASQCQHQHLPRAENSTPRRHRIYTLILPSPLSRIRYRPTFAPGSTNNHHARSTPPARPPDPPTH